MEVDARFPRDADSKYQDIDTEQQSTTTTRWEGHKATALGTPKQLLC